MKRFITCEDFLGCRWFYWDLDSICFSRVGGSGVFSFIGVWKCGGFDILLLGLGLLFFFFSEVIRILGRSSGDLYFFLRCFLRVCWC